ncbi:efflux RND transporter permease subunit, partial [Escherichia coli]|uniref:efflux RND transporter permease subunit n=1 Tax=Escherichia coli TaxID=562 RepID=UPI001172F5E4
ELEFDASRLQVSLNQPGLTPGRVPFELPPRGDKVLALRALPAEMTSPPSYRKVNPADAPVLLVALTSPSMDLTELNDYAENLLSPGLSTIDGVAQV